MQVKAGTKATFATRDGLRWPGVCLGTAESVPTVIEDRNTHEPVTINVTHVDILSLRESRAGDKYLVISNEVVTYGFRPKMEPRFSSIEGLDVTAEGERIGLQELLDLHGTSQSAYLAAQFSASRGTVDAADI